MAPLCRVQVFIIAVFNFVIVYYVFTSVNRGDNGKFFPKVEVDIVETQSQEEEKSDDGLMPPSLSPITSPPNSSSSVGAVEVGRKSMKNFLFGKAQGKNDTDKNANDVSSDGDSPAAGDEELRARLQDSAEIELYPRDPSGLPAHPVLEFESSKLASLVDIEHFNFQQTNC